MATGNRIIEHYDQTVTNYFLAIKISTVSYTRYLGSNPNGTDLSPSFPRRRESTARIHMDSRLRGNDVRRELGLSQCHTI